MAEIRHVLFFAGHFNDIDHLSPVAYKLAESGLARPIMLITDPLYDIANDYRLRYLRERHGIPVTYVHNFHAPFVVPGLVLRLLRLPGARKLLGWNQRFVLRAIRKAFYGREWARHILKRYDPAALVFEWAYPAGGIEGAFVSEGLPRPRESRRRPPGARPTKTGPATTTPNGHQMSNTLGSAVSPTHANPRGNR
jgi:hypothetical protein